MGLLAEAVAVEREVSFADAGLPASSVPGHAGKFILGKLGGTPVVLMKGRVHLYEGHGPRLVTAGVRWMAHWRRCKRCPRLLQPCMAVRASCLMAQSSAVQMWLRPSR